MLSFYPEELTAVHFGCRIDEHQKNELAKLARALNPKTHFYQAAMARREYALEWECVAGT
jgi:predicted GIY-YIG superfamily endonuclease